MVLLTPDGWQDYQLLDSGNEQRLERFGEVLIVRPDPQAIWKPQLPTSEWQKAQAVFQKKNEDKLFPSESKGNWQVNGKVPERWLINYQDLKMWIKLTPFKHTGVFPEQAVHWQWMNKLITERKKQESNIQVLNLFAYTGMASLVAAQAGAQVTHVDASRPTIGWAKDNQLASDLQDKPIRWILDDVIKFCEREVRRGKKYHGIIMDPPIYGHGPSGETWKFHQSFPKLMQVCQQLLVDQPLFVIVNAYAISASAVMLENVLADFLKDFKGTIESGELALEQTNSKRKLSTGIFARWSAS